MRKKHNVGYLKKPLKLKKWIHSHKKRKDSLKGTLDRVLFAAKLEFPKIPEPRIPQNTPN